MSAGLSNFDWKFYATYYADLRSAGIDNEKKALEHYIYHGRKEKRLPNADSLDPDLRETVLSAMAKLGQKLDTLVEVITPPKQSFFEIPHQFWDYLIQLGGIQKTSSILEIGCGRGHLAQHVAEYLTEAGNYFGCDTDRKNIEWCRTEIAASHPHCTFQSISHSHHSHGSRKSLPYENGKFDVVFASSFFLKLSAEEARHYIAEISRVLKVGGCCLVTCFLWNPAIDNLIKSGKTQIKNASNSGEYFNLQNFTHEHAIAYPESQMIQWHEHYKLPIKHILYGNWSGNVAENAHQDLICAHRIK
jgi:ubiquinone/menaquinone biosynthesis C-methylase UbiE